MANEQLSKTDEDLIGEDLEKLFVFQDKHLSKEKRSILVKALSESRIPSGAIILGIRKLMNDDLNSLKLGTILAAARTNLEVDTPENRCPDCSNGMVVMKDAEGRYFSLACQCGMGFNVQRTHGLKRWGGHKTQTSKSRMLTKDGEPIRASQTEAEVPF